MKSIISILTNKNTKFLLTALFIIAIIPPLLAIIIKNPPLFHNSDDFDYNQIAIGLLGGKGFHSNVILIDTVELPNIRHPLYPLFLAVVYFFTNNSVIAAKLIQILMHGLTCVIIFLIAEKLFKNRFISFAAGIVWAAYPLSIFLCIRLMTETPFLFLLAASILFLLKSQEAPNLKNGLLCGFLLGLTALTKSVILAFIPFLFLWLILSSENKLKLKLKSFSIIMLFMGLTIFPWLVRNYIVLGNFFPITPGSGYALYRYTNEKTLKVMNTPIRLAFPFTEEQKKKILTMSEVEIDRYLHKLAWQFVKSHPKDFLKMKWNELYFFWHLWPASPKRYTEYYRQEKEQKLGRYNVFLYSFLERFKNSYFLYFCKILYHMPYNILFLGMFISFFSSFRRDKEQWRKSLLLFMLIATITTVYVLHHGHDRYRLTIDPYVFILGVHGVVSFYDSLKRPSALPGCRPRGRKR